MSAGPSALRHLSVLPATGFKIDRVIVRRTLQNAHDSAVAKVLADPGLTLSPPATAEGIETMRQATLLRNLGVSHAQGYLHWPSQPSHRLLDHLATAEAMPA